MKIETHNSFNLQESMPMISYIPHNTLDQPQEAIKVVEWEITGSCCKRSISSAQGNRDYYKLQ